MLRSTRVRPIQRCRGALGVLVAVTLSGALGCDTPVVGPSEGDPPEDQQSQVRDVVTDVLTTNDPEHCGTVLTSRLMEQSFGSNSTVNECRYQNRSAKDTSAHEVSFEHIDVHGKSARATVAISGGYDDGSKVTLELIRDGDQWEVDYLADIEIDRNRFDQSVRTQAAAEGYTSREADCFVGRLGHLHTTKELERELVKGNYRGFAAAEALCLSRATLFRELRDAMLESPPKDLPEPIVDCVVQRITEGLSITQLRAVIAEDDRARLQSIGATAGKACAKDYQSGLLGERPPS
jgi:hypothetical protein